MKKVLTIAGSDCSGGAGIQADLKTFTAHNVYGMSVITALTAQNTTGVQGVFDTDPEFVGKQIDSVFSDIRPDAVKIGMVSSAEIIRVIASKLREYGAKNIVCDPVMVATSGGKLMRSGAVEELMNTLIPISDIITPNIPEAEVLIGKEISGEKDMEKAAAQIGEKYKVSVLLKGGHLKEKAVDFLYSGGEIFRFDGKRINTKNTHGTGCTLSSAIACGLALGKSLKESVKSAKDYLTSCLDADLNIGSGCGPINHMASLFK